MLKCALFYIRHLAPLDFWFVCCGWATLIIVDKNTFFDKVQQDFTSFRITTAQPFFYVFSANLPSFFGVLMRWVVNFVRHAMRPSELINPVAFVQMLPGRCTPVQLAAAACCKKFLYIQ